MIKKYAILLFSLLGLVAGPMAPVMANSPLSECKTEMVALFRQADQQRDWMKQLLEKREVDLSQLSLKQMQKTVTKLENYKERLMKAQDSGKQWGEEEKKYLLLVQELIRQLTNARIACEKRVKSVNSVTKLVVPVGAAIAVTGGLLLLDMFTDLDIDTSTALLCGLATGVAIGTITYREELSQGIGPLGQALKQAWHASSWHSAGKVAAAVVGAAAMGGALWHKREAIAGTFGWRSSQRSLSQVAHENGLGTH